MGPLGEDINKPQSVLCNAPQNKFLLIIYQNMGKPLWGGFQVGFTVVHWDLGVDILP